MKGRYWDYKNNKPEPKLLEFLDDKVDSVRKRIKEGTGVDIEPIYFSAGFKEAGEEQRPYNLSKLLYFIIQHTPKEKRLVYLDNISSDDDMWKDNDDLKDYSTEIKMSFIDTVSDCATNGADIGGDIGSIFGGTGEKIGRAAGTVVGAAVGVVKAIFSKW